MGHKHFIQFVELFFKLKFTNKAAVRDAYVKCDKQYL
jgi:hypothetical protein